MASSKKFESENQDLKHGLKVYPTMPYYCTWLPGACPVDENRTQGSPLTQPPMCPPATAGAQTIVPTIVPPCPTIPPVCYPTINPVCHQPSPAVAQIAPVCGVGPHYQNYWAYATYFPSLILPLCPQKEAIAPPAEAAPVQKEAGKTKTKKQSTYDLTIIEGIGPKSSTVLKAGGFGSFTLIAQSNKEELESILKEGGLSINLFDATTWPEQAQLAAEGKWEELEQLKEILKHGKRD